MSTAEDIWREKSDVQVLDAAAHLDEYTDEGRRVLQLELQRRGLSLENDLSNLSASANPSVTRTTEAPYTLRPLTLGELLDRTFLLYRRHFVLFVGITALPGAFALLVTTFAATVRTDVRTMTPWLTLGLILAWVVVYVVAAVFTQGAAVIAVSHVQLGQPTSIVESFSSMRPRIGGLLVLSLNMGIRISLGLMLLIVPGVVLMMTYALAIPVAVLEDTTVSESLSRSADLTRGQRGRIFLIYLLVFVLSTIITLLWQAPLAVVATSLGTPPIWVQVVVPFGSFVTRSLIGPFVPIALALVYFDQRVRKEAFDLEHMMQQLDGLTPDHPTV
jgi:hypothetical protein